MKSGVAIRARLEALERAYRASRGVVLALLLNALLCWFVYLLVGGSALLSETPFEGPPFIQVGTERVVVSRALYEFSLWHGASVFLSVPCFVLFVLAAACQRGRLGWLRRRSRRSSPPSPTVVT